MKVSAPDFSNYFEEPLEVFGKAREFLDAIGKNYIVGRNQKSEIIWLRLAVTIDEHLKIACKYMLCLYTKAGECRKNIKQLSTFWEIWKKDWDYLGNLPSRISILRHPTKVNLTKKEIEEHLYLTVTAHLE